MNKPRSLTVARIGQVLIIVSVIVFIASIIPYLFYTSRRNNDLSILLNPASNPTFNIAMSGIHIVQMGAVAALLFAVTAFILEMIDAKKYRRPRNTTLAVRTMIASIFLLLNFALQGFVPFYSTRHDKSEPNAAVKEILQNDVEVRIGMFNTADKSIPVTVTNKRTEATDYIIVIDAIDKNGYRLAEDSVYTVGLGAHETQEYKIFRLAYTKAQPDQLKAATYKVVSILPSK